jgi:hypothetical protein
VSEYNPGNIGMTRRTLPDPVSDDPLETEAGDLPRREREGLPSSYRMRADPHYVELLTAQSDRVERPASSEPAWRTRRAGDVPAGEPRADAQDPRGERLLAEVAEELTTIASAAALLASDPSAMTRRVGADLVLAGAWRASWLVHAHGLLAGTHRPRIQAREIGGLVSQVREGFAAECRLSGLGIEVRVPAWNALVRVDESAFVTGLSGAVLWTLSAAGETDGATIVVAVEVSDGQLDSVDVSYAAGVAAPLPARGRAPIGTARATDEWTPNLGASAAKAAARLHGGDAAFLAGDGRGSTVRFTFGKTR